MSLASFFKKKTGSTNNEITDIPTKASNFESKCFCVRCKKDTASSKIKWVGTYPFCETCFDIDDFNCHKNYSYASGDEKPEIIMPDLLEDTATHIEYEDVVIKEYIPLCDIVHELKTISENFIRDKHDRYSGEVHSEVICLDPHTKKYYLMRKSQRGAAFPRPGDHSSSRNLIVREIEQQEITNDILRCVSGISSSLPEYLKEFPSYSDGDISVALSFDEDSKYSLPDKLYCTDFDFHYGDEYCYLRKVNGYYRLFYLKRFNRGIRKIEKACSESFITSIFERIDSLNENPLPKDYSKHKGTALLFHDTMPVFACDRKLSDDECRAISSLLFSTSPTLSEHKINGFYVLLSGDNFKLVELPPKANNTQILYKALVHIAKHGI